MSFLPVEETLNKFTRDVINTIVNDPTYPVIKANQKNAVRPSVPHCTVNTLTNVRVGWEEIQSTDRTVDPDIDFFSSGYREITFSLNFFKSGAYDIANSVNIGLVRESIQDIFRAANFGLLDRTNVRKISEPLEDGWEERAQFDFALSAIGTDEEIIRSIEIVSISGEFQTRGEIIPINIEV